MTKENKFAIGTSDFKDIIKDGSTYVDKTLFIKEVMEDHAKVILFTRPRRFGKTLNMSMLYHFLKREGEDFFGGLKIKEHGDFCAQYQNKYPVIFLTFKDMKPTSFKSFITAMKRVLNKLYAKERFLTEGDFLNEEEKEYFQGIVNKKINDPEELAGALCALIQYLHKYHGIRPILILDEYDTPIQEAYLQGYYEKMIPFMRVLLGSALKDNSDLEKAVLTGITRVSQESMFSGLNNIRVYTLMDQDYGEFFGFTEDEVISLLPENIHIEPIREWYNGYQIGPWKIYNPWSIISCLASRGEIDIYWINTSSNELVFQLIKKGGVRFREKFSNILQGIPQRQLIERGLTFTYLQNNTNAVWTLLLHAGYLNSLGKELDDASNLYATLSIPNKEIRGIYCQTVQKWFADEDGALDGYEDLVNALKTGNVEKFTKEVRRYIRKTSSYFDFNTNMITKG